MHNENDANSKSANDGGWAEPLPLFEVDLPSFPSSAFPSWIQEFVEQLAMATQTPLDLPGVMALAALSTVSAGQAIVHVFDGYEEPLNLYLVVALGPGNRKSSVVSAVTKPIQEFEALQAEKLGDEIRRAATAREIKEKELETLKRRAAETDDPKDQGELKRRAEDLAVELSKIWVPACPRFLVDDCTPERLANLLAENEGRLSFLNAEGGIFEIMAGRYSGNTPNLDVFLKGHSGDTIRVDRNKLGSRPVFVERPALTFGLAVQPDVVFGLAGKPGFSGRGLIGRFLYSHPRSLLGGRETRPPGVKLEVLERYRKNLHWLLENGMRNGQGGVRGTTKVQFSKGAQDVLDRFRKEIEIELGANGGLHCLEDWGSKLPGAVVRFAGLFHIAAHVESGGYAGIPVQEEHVKAAIQLGLYFIPHAKSAYQMMGSTGVFADAKFALDCLMKLGEDRVSKQTLWQKTKGRYHDVKRLNAALALLEEHHYVVLQQKNRQGPGQKPAPEIVLSPKVRSYNSYDSWNGPQPVNSSNSRNSRREEEDHV